jgi:glycosyltransferase involved in cell wall biosynthesis
MHILLVTYFFPPYNTMGAVRTGKTAKYLTELGHEVTVISATPQALTRDLDLEIPRDRVTYTPWLGPPSLKRVKLAAAAPSDGLADRRWLGSLARRVYWELMIPDQHLGWLPFALRAARAAIRKGDVDVILASASPLTSLLVGRSASRHSDVPWVAELRDSWMDHPYRPHFMVRDYLEAPLERRTLADAAGLVGVTAAQAAGLRLKYPGLVEVVHNGYEPHEVLLPHVPGTDSFVIRYTGSMYEGMRVPRLLFRCLRELDGAVLPVRAEFYGSDLGHVGKAAAEAGVGDIVRCFGRVPRRESLELQRNADVLLLASTPLERAGLTGKLFEYMNARRPILVVGCPDGEAADLVRSTGCGFVAEGMSDLKTQLEAWQAEKASAGRLPDGPPPPQGFTRLEQTRVLAEFLETVVQQHRAQRRASLRRPVDTRE